MILKRFNVERSATDPDKIKALKAEGYVPVIMEAALPPVEEPAPVVEEKPLDKMIKSELVSLAYERGIENAKALTKAELIEVLRGDDSDG